MVTGDEKRKDNEAVGKADKRPVSGPVGKESAKQSAKPVRRPLVKILTNEATIGVVSLLIIAVVALVYGQVEVATLAGGGIAAMVKNIGGED